MYYKLFFILLSAVMVSCKSDALQESLVTIDVNVNNVKILRLQNCDKTTLLQNGENALIGHVSKMIATDNYYIIATNKRLSIFDKDGQFVTHIGNQGRAQNEYIGITDFWIENNSVFIYDMNGGKRILQYSLNDSLMKSTSVPSSISKDFIPFNFLIPFHDVYIGKCVWDGTVKTSPALACYDKQFNMIKHFVEPTLNCGLYIGYPLFKTTDEILYWNALRNTVYSVSEQLQISSKYRISFGNNNFPQREYANDDYELLNAYMNDESQQKIYASIISYIWQTSQELIFTYSYQNKSHFVVFNLDTKQTECWQMDCTDIHLRYWCYDGKSLYVLADTESDSGLYKVWPI